MTLGAWLTFVAASAALIAIPGPNVALIVANSMAHGRRYGLVTVAGTSAAMVPQLTLTVAGMTGALALASQAFEWVRWLGVAYLVWLRIQAWRAPPLNLTEVGPESSAMRAIFARGFLVSLSNPKTLLFYGAFLPQFVPTHSDPLPQLALLAATFLVVAVALDTCWALAAARLRYALSLRAQLRNRLIGGFYFAAALGLASVRRTA